MSWATVKLADVCQIDGGYAFKSKDFSDHGIPIVRISNLTNTSVNLKDVVRIPERVLSKNSQKFLLKPGDILIAMSGATTGKIGVMPEKYEGQCLLNQRVGRFRVMDSTVLDQKFLHCFVLSPIFQTQVLNFAAGAAQPNISPKQLVAFQVLLPPLKEQHRIVELLDRAQTLIDKRKEQIILMDQLIQSLFYDMFGDPVTNPKGWNSSDLGKLVESIRYGTNEKGLDKEIEESTPMLRIPNIKPSCIDYTDIKYAKLSNSDLQKYLLKKGDLLLVRSNGNPDYIGRCALFSADDLFIYASYLIRIRLNSRFELNPFFAERLLSSVEYRRLLRRLGRTTAGNFNINTPTLKMLKIILPPIELQNKFAERIQQIEIQKKAMTNSLKELEDNFNSLSQRAFKGNLTKQ